MASPFVRFERTEIEQSLSDRFEQQVRRFPDKLAVKTTRDALTYSQLNALANRVAHEILSQRGSDNEPVALLFGQSTGMVAAILGILKAGKIYVPLDPFSPSARNADILTDSTAAILLTDAAHFAKARELAPPSVSVLCLDELGEQNSTDNPGLALEPDQLAYIFYTSGSTGKPKGLADTHRNVLHNIMRYTNSLRIGADDRLTLLQSASFSGAVSSLFCALLNGATSFPFSLQHEGPDRLASWVSEERLTMFHAVPSIFRLLPDGKHSYPALRVIRLEGDQAAPTDIELFKHHFPDSCILVNGLGATECGIVRQFFVSKDTPTPDGVVPIGQAVEDMEILLLDESGQAVGHDTVGEIAIRSRYLAPGYWRRPDLTAAAFSTDPQERRSPDRPVEGQVQGLADQEIGAPVRGIRIYRTGDLGRMRADGCLEYLGRKHFQLKIRGQWVELATVEKALREQGTFKDVVALTIEDQTNEPRLVAYLVPNAGPSPTVDEIRRQLVQALPSHMIPSAFVMLDALPLNAFGKLDRRALPAPSPERPALNVSFVEPQDMLQRQLQFIWEDVLRIQPIGIRDSFFDLGGDSLRALTMLRRVEEATGRTLAPDLLLSEATIEHLARHIEDENIGQQQPIVEVQKGNGLPPFYFLHGDYFSGGFYCANLARQLGSDRPFYALPPCGVNGHPAPHTYQEMARFHVQVLRAKQPVGPYLLGGTCNGGLVAFEMARILAAEGERVDALVLIGASASNLRFKRLKQFVAPLGILSERVEARAFARLQDFWSAMNQLPASRRPALVLRKLPKVFSLLRDLLAREGESNELRSTETKRTASRTEIRAKYQRIDREYWPGPYAGKVTLFWWEGEDERPQQAAHWWREVAGEVDLHAFPTGKHADFLTKRIEEVAAKLRPCLDGIPNSQNAGARIPSPPAGERVRVRGQSAEQRDEPESTTASAPSNPPPVSNAGARCPLTPALSPAGGEGEPAKKSAAPIETLRSRIVSGLGWTAASQAMGQVLQLVIAAILARLLSPHEYGLLGMVLVFTGFAANFADLSLGASIIQKQDVSARHLDSVFWLNVAVGALLTALFALAAPLVAAFYGEPALRLLTIAVAASFILNSLARVQSALLDKSLNFRAKFWINLAATVLSGSVALTMAFNGAGVWSLVAQSLVASLVSTAILWGRSTWRPRLAFDFSAIKELMRFSNHLTAFGIINYWGRNFDTLVIGRVLGSAPLGIYSLANRLMQLPLTNVTHITNDVMFPALSAIQHDVPAVARGYLRANRMIALLTFPMMIGLSALAEPAILAVYGEKWRNAAGLVQILAFDGLLQSIYNTAWWVILSQGNTRRLLQLGILATLLRMAGVLIGIRWGLTGAAWGYFLSGFPLWYATYATVSRLTQLRLSELLKNLAGPFCCAAIMGGAIWFSDQCLSHRLTIWTRLILQVPAGVLLYLFLIRQCRLQAWRDVGEVILERGGERSRFIRWLTG